MNARGTRRPRGGGGRGPKLSRGGGRGGGGGGSKKSCLVLVMAFAGSVLVALSGIGFLVLGQVPR